MILESESLKPFVSYLRINIVKDGTWDEDAAVVGEGQESMEKNKEFYMTQVCKNRGLLK